MELNQPLVCICIPNFNNEATLSETLDSLVSQTYKNIKIKVFDNASTDSSLEILRSYEKRYNHISVFVNERNIGAEANFTKCIEHMEGEYSAIFHSDDVYMPNIIEEEVYVLSENDDVGSVYTNSLLIDSNSSIKGVNFYPRALKKNVCSKLCFLELLKLTIRNENFLMCPSVLVRTYLYKEYIVNWSTMNFASASDVDVWFRLAEHSNLMIIDKPLVKYRLSENSFSFRELKGRVVEKDLFKVLDHYIGKCRHSLSDSDIRNYEYLVFKEKVLIIFNKLKRNICVSSEHLNVFDFNIFLRSLRGRKTFLIYSFAVFLSFVVLPFFRLKRKVK